jgi:hypothetical protein
MKEFMSDVQELSFDEIESVSGGGSWGTFAGIATAVTDFASGFVAGVKAAMKDYM